MNITMENTRSQDWYQKRKQPLTTETSRRDVQAKQKPANEEIEWEITALLDLFNREI